MLSIEILPLVVIYLAACLDQDRPVYCCKQFYVKSSSVLKLQTSVLASILKPV